MYWVLPGGWRCQPATGGGGACTRGGTAIQARPVASGSSPTRHLRYCDSPDKKVSCTLIAGPPQAFCDSGNTGAKGFHGGNLDRNGKVIVCNHPPTGNYCGALGGNFPVLRYGESDELYGFRCISAPDGITCVLTAGAGRGKGFRINQNEAVRVG
jgi:hypothetical protein